MKHLILPVLAAAVLLTGCKNNNSPSPTTTTSTATTTSTTSTTTTTTTTTTVPGATTFSLTGTVTANIGSTPVADAEIEILDGPNAGKTTRTSAAGAYSFAGLPAGTFTIRVRARSVPNQMAEAPLTLHVRSYSGFGIALGTPQVAADASTTSETANPEE